LNFRRNAHAFPSHPSLTSISRELPPLMDNAHSDFLKQRKAAELYAAKVEKQTTTLLCHQTKSNTRAQSREEAAAALQKAIGQQDGRRKGWHSSYYHPRNTQFMQNQARRFNGKATQCLSYTNTPTKLTRVEAYSSVRKMYDIARVDSVSGRLWIYFCDAERTLILNRHARSSFKISRYCTNKSSNMIALLPVHVNIPTLLT